MRDIVLLNAAAGLVAWELAQDAALVRKIGVSGTPTLIVNGKLISGFQQGELEAFLDGARAKPTVAGSVAQ